MIDFDYTDINALSLDDLQKMIVSLGYCETKDIWVCAFRPAFKQIYNIQKEKLYNYSTIEKDLLCFGCDKRTGYCKKFINSKNGVIAASGNLLSIYLFANETDLQNFKNIVEILM